jgi:hypothetical protein
MYKIKILSLIFVVLSTLFFPSCAIFKKKGGDANEWGENDNAFKEKKSIFSIFKKKKVIDPIQDAKSKENSNFQTIDGHIFDGRNLNQHEQKKISKQIAKYEKQKPNKWEENFIAMRQRGYPVHPDTMQKYKRLEPRLKRQKDKRTRKMKKIYKKSLYQNQGSYIKTNEDVGKALKQKNKETTAREKKRMRQVKRKQRTGHYLPFYLRWYEKFFGKKKKK